MKVFLCLLIAFSCQSVLCAIVPFDSEYEKPKGGVFIQGELPKRDISKDKISSISSSKVNTTRIRIEEVLPQTTTQELDLLPEAETEPQDKSEAVPKDKPEAKPHDKPEAKPQDELGLRNKTQPKNDTEAKPKVEPATITDNTFSPCSFIPCPFIKKATNPKFRPLIPNSSSSKLKITESNDDDIDEYQLSLEFYHNLSFQLLLLSLFCLTLILLLTAVLVATYLTKNGFGLRRFRKLENRDCGLNKYNF